MGDLSWETITILVLLALIAIYAERTNRRVLEIKTRLGRLSFTFLKIENEIDCLQRMLIVHSRVDGKNHDQVVRQFHARLNTMDHIVSSARNGGEILRGLEEPDWDEDKRFWKHSLSTEMGLRSGNSAEDAKD